MTKQVQLKKLIMSNIVIIGIALLVIVTAIWEPKFLSGQNLVNIMRQFGPLSFISLGMTFVIMGGFIDLSLGGMISLISVVTLLIIDYVGQVPALLIGTAIGATLGYMNSVLLVGGGAMKQAEALFITYGLGVVYSALAFLFSNGSTINMNSLSSDTTVFSQIGSGNIGFISISFAIFLVCLAVLYIFQVRSYIGREISLTGGNKVCAGLAGIPVKRCINIIYTICGVMTAIGTVVLFSRVKCASPVIGKNYETNAILAVIIGGNSLAGGKGSVLRTVLGVVLVTLLSNCMNLLGVSTYMQTILRGAVLMLAIWLDNRKQG